jgi:hypothetical protein
MHPFIARLIPALPAAGIDHDLARRFTRREIIMYRSARQLERAFHGVKDVIQRELYLRLGRIEFEQRLLSKQSGRRGQQK